MKATFLHPKYWPTWLGIGILRLFEPLPHSLLYLLGRWLGGFIHLFPTPFKRIARRNIELALPELDERGAARILREHFAGLGCALFETAMSWWSSDERIRRITLHDRPGTSRGGAAPPGAACCCCRRISIPSRSAAARSPRACRST